MAGLLSKLWDDVAGGSPPEKGMKQLRKQSSANSALFRDAPADAAKTKLERRLSSGEYQSPTSEKIAIYKPLKFSMLSIDCPSDQTPTGSTPPNSPSMASPSPYSQEKDKLWRSVFHQGQNKVMRKIGSEKFDKAQLDDSPTAYDWVVITALEG